jgi:hypothetical protein
LLPLTAKKGPQSEARESARPAEMPDAVIGVTRSPEEAASDAFVNNVRSVEAAFKRFQAVSVEELSHDPSDLLGFFVDEDPADDAPTVGADADYEWSTSENAAAALPPKVLVDGLPWEERNTIYSADPDMSVANGQRHYRTADGFHLYRSITGSWFFSTRFTPGSDVCLASLRADALLGTHHWNVLIAPRTWMQMPVTIRGPVSDRAHASSRDRVVGGAIGDHEDAAVDADAAASSRRRGKASS